MDKSIPFKVNSETNVEELIKLNHTVVKRIRALEAHRILPKAEVIDGRTSEERIGDPAKSVDS
jgi:hypothetical protein